MKSENQTNHIPPSTKGWIKLLAKIGFISKGVVYITVGILAALAAYTTKIGSKRFTRCFAGDF